ncbi:glutamine synthetase family protein [Magnetovibrio sp.]|uniref:glutamine synthetase family protein n=1 Tax=Magnetovibrio sp. TaxID=2024836 RepID=UPI002F921193
MKSHNPEAARLEAEAFLDAHPRVQHVDALFVDINGIMRGKRYPRAEVPHLYEKGMLMPYSAMVVDVTGNTSDAGGVGFSDGDPDGVMFPVPGTLVPVPWAHEPTAQCIVSFDASNGGKEFLEPRNILERVDERLRADGLNAVCALELEFYLIDPQRTPDGRPQAPISPATGEREISTQVYGMEELEDYSAVLSDIEKTCHAQGVPAYTASAEYASGQFEVNLKHSSPAVVAADHAALLCRVVRNVALEHGFRATFMAKPFLDQAGNGLHIHTSVLNEAGKNLFSDGDDPVSNQMLRNAIGGMQAALFQSMAVFAPCINGYRRYQPNIYVPMGKTWGVNNRSLAFRIPLGDNGARRIEHRVAGADANPYLALAAVLAGLHHGIVNKLDPGEPNTGNAGAEPDPEFPRTIEEGLVAFKEGGILTDYFGDMYSEIYHLTKVAEVTSFRDYISKREYDWYL